MSDPAGTAPADALALAQSPAVAILAAVASGRTTVSEVAAGQLRTIAEREPGIRAFAHLDPDAVQAAAQALDSQLSDGSRAPLLGLPVGVKDLIDTADQPTEYGSGLFAGHRPDRDAAVVRALREAGALVTGKTVTTEFALFHPGPTRNPHDLRRTPGGSSSGSAVAVAAGMLPVALGTQTAGSITRPASFCGVVGFKPTYGAIDRDGVLLISETLDTVGLLGRSVRDIGAVFDVVRAAPGRHRAPGAGPALGGLRIGFARPAEWELAEPATRRAIEGLSRRLGDSGFEVSDVALPAGYGALSAAQSTVMEFEVSRNLRDRCEADPSRVSDALAEVLRRGASVSARDYSRALDLAAACRAELPAVFAGLDALVLPAVIGEAPLGIERTGDPVFCRAWTLLHCPTISLPLLRGPSGMPVGVQLVGVPGSDDGLLRAAEALMALPSTPAPGWML